MPVMEWIEIGDAQTIKKKTDWYNILHQVKKQNKTNFYHTIEEYEKSSTESEIPKLEYRQ